MKNNKSLIVGALVMALLVVSIGYAAITTIALVVNGSASASASQGNFKVVFTGTPSVDDDQTVGAGTTASGTVDASEPTKATMNVSGMTAKGDTVTVKFPVKNESTDLSANLSALVSDNSNQEYFDVKTSLEDASIAANGATNLVVTAKLIKTPINDGVVSGTFVIGLSALPIQPAN